MAQDKSFGSRHDNHIMQEDLLAKWPLGRAVGLLALGPEDPTGDFATRLVRHAGVTSWWSAVAQNMFVGPTVRPPFARMHFIEMRDAKSASHWFDECFTDQSSHRWTVLACNPAPKRAQRIMRAMHLALRWLPAPPMPVEAPSDLSARPGDMNPSEEQYDAMAAYPPEAPVLVLNLNRHKREGVHPDTGARHSGHELADLYFKRGISTFNRLGARTLWFGGCKGALRDDLDAGVFDQFGLVLYPSRQRMYHLLRIGRREGWDRYRMAGLDRSWIVHCRITGSSVSRDVADESR